MADGSLKFDTKIDTDGFEKGTKTLKERLDSVVESLRKTGTETADAFSGETTSKVIDLNNKIEETERKAEALREEMQKLASTPFVSKDAEKLSAEVEKTKQELFALIDAQKQYVEAQQRDQAELGLPVQSRETIEAGLAGSKEWEKLSEQIEKTGNKLIAYRSQLEGVQAVDAKVTATGTDEYIKKEQELLKLTNSLEVYKARLNEVRSAEEKKAKSADSADKSTKKLNNTLKKTSKTSIPLTKSILKLSNMFKLLVIRMAMRAAIRAVQEGFENLAQYSDQANKDISALKTSLQTLKNNFASAFAPILQFVVPALQTLINYLSQALSVIGQFFVALLNGATTYTKATDAQVDYAKSLKDTAKAAAKSLSPIDKLNTVADSGAGGGGYKGPSPSEMFEEVEISNKILESVARLKAGLSEFASWFSETFAPIIESVRERMLAGAELAKERATYIFADLQTLAEPLLNYFNEILLPGMKEVGIGLGEELDQWFLMFDKIFMDIWTAAAFPLLEKFTTRFLPTITDVFLKMMSLNTQLLGNFRKIFTLIWDDALKPLLDLISKMALDIIDIISDFWDKWGEPLFNNMSEMINNIGDLFETVWETTIRPVWEAFMEVVDKLWDEHLKPFLANVLDLVGTLLNAAMDIYNGFIAPIVKWFVQKFGPPIAKVISFLIRNVGDFLGNLIDAASGIIDALKGLINFIAGVFTGDWERAWEGIKDIFKGVWNAMVSIAKTPINIIIGMINAMLKGIVSGVNAAIKAINKISISIPDWVPGIGGKSIGFNFKTLTAPRIPKLATGTVVPANYGEFMAILGDNTREAEVVSPLSTMKQAFKEALAENGGGNGNINLNVYLDGKQIHSEIVKQDKQYKDQTGRSAFAY